MTEEVLSFAIGFGLGVTGWVVGFLTVIVYLEWRHRE